MDLVLEPGDDGGAADAVRAAIAHTGVWAAARSSVDRGAWWRAGLAAALDRGPAPPAEPTPVGYATPSPRRTRGAIRA